MGTQHRWIWLFLVVLIKVVAITSKELRVVCYYTNWSVYRPGNAKFSPQNINPYLCTHLVYAFGGFTKENTLKPFDKYQDIEKGGYAKFTGLKTYNKNLKTMLAIGGWNEGSSRFSPMVASAERRKELVKNVVKFLRQNHFDGLDLDWEYPSFRDGGKARDKDNYAQLVQELREEFERESKKTGRPRLILTMAVPAGIEYINKGYDVPKLMKYLDWMNILSYDYHSAFEPSVNHHAPLYPLEEDNEYNYDTELNIEHTIQHYLKAGAISDKLVLGIPTYGRSYTLFNPDATDIGAPADGPGEMGDATRENGYLAYYEICEAVNSGEWTVVQPNDEAMGPYAYKDNQWVGYDDEAIARKKSQYVADKDLGGIMFWAIDNDDFRGTCHNKSYPIIEAAKEALVDALGLGNENAIQKPTKNAKPRTSRLRNKPATTEEPSTERTRNSGGRQGIEPTSSRRRPQGRGDEGTKPRRRRPGARRNEKSTTVANEPASESGSSLVVTTPSWKTPEPPTTPDPGGDFKCEDEGFYPHPRDCKKYFWCLSGPSELGIIAHQFTCPAGLFFNKAASSCDYTQNVLCNKKIKTTTTTTTTPLTTSVTKGSGITTTTEESKKPAILSIFSTRRPPPKITAATSRTTFVSTTSSTTPEYDEEYEEYEDEEDSKETNDTEADSEDPQVIKELLELIKKAGGIEELEKQLNFKDDASTPSQSGSTTASPIKQALYQRVLAKTKLSDPTTRQNSVNYIPVNRNRNSRGPQNEGILKEEKTAKFISRPKYSTITRTRTSKVEEQEKEVQKDDEEEVPLKEVPEVKEVAKPKYISLRRNRVSTTAATIEDEIEEEPVKRPELSTTSKSPYVTLRRSRPTTSTAKPIDEPLDRDILGENEEYDKEVDTASPNYVVLNRQRSSTSTSTTSRYKEIRRSTTTTTTPAPETEVPEKEEDVAVTFESPTDDTNSKITNTLLTTISDEPVGHTLSFETTTPEATISSTTTTTTTTTEVPKNEIIEPQLLDPRPFSVSNIAKFATPTSPTIKKFRPSTTTLAPEPEAPKVSPQSLRTRPLPVAVDSNVQTQTRGRTRGTARFTLKTDSQNSPDQYQQQQPHINTERHYRPETSRFSDLSSLTAVDFAFNVNNANQNNGGRQRSRPRTTTSTVVTQAPTGTDTLPASTTVTTTTISTRPTQETFKTGSRTLTLARKYLENSQFGSSRRRPTTTTTVSDEGVNVRLKTAADEPRVNKFQRTIVRRLRPLPTTPATVSTEALEVSQTRRFGGRKTTPLPYRRRQNELDAVSNDDEDEENIKLSESNILENSDLNRGNTNAIKDDSKTVPRKVIKRIRFPISSTASTTTSTTPSAIIESTTSESTISGSSKGTVGPIDEISENIEVIPETTSEAVRSTEPNIIVRTRVILRKLSTTTPAPKVEVTENLPEEKTRKYRIIKRIRPTTSTSTSPLIEEDEDKENDVPMRTRLIPVSSNKYNPSLYIRSTTERTTTERLITESTTPTTLLTPGTSASTTSPTTITSIGAETTIQPETEQPEIPTTPKLPLEVELEQELTENDTPIEIETTESITEEPITSSTASTPVYTNKIYKSAEDRPKLDLKSRAFTNPHVESTTRGPLRFESRSKKPFKLRPTESSLNEDARREEVEDVGHGSVKPFRKSSSPRTFPRFGVTKEDVESDNLRTISSTLRSYSRTPYRFTKGTTEATIDDDFVDDDEDEVEKEKEVDEFEDTIEEDEEEPIDDDVDDEDEDEKERDSSNFSPRPNLNRPNPPRFNLNRSPKPEASTRRANTPYNPNSSKATKSGKTTTRSYKRFTSTTPVTNTADLADINVEALNQRNKQLFTKARKMNTPFTGTTTSLPSVTQSETSSQPETSTNDMTEMDFTTDKLDLTTFSNEIEATDKPVTSTDPHSKVTTTEKPTTFYHIFAETESSVTEHQETLNTVDGEVPNHFEKLIEVNRIVEINNGSNLDHIGVINRVTNIEVVNGDGKTNQDGLPKGELKINISGPRIETEYLNPLIGDLSESSRQERKYEIYGDSKVLNYTRQNPILVNAKSVEIIPNQIVIESKSNVRTITPKPLFLAEVSTIALEGLFRTEAPIYAEISSAESKDGEELLETEHTRYVNVKVLDQDFARAQKAILDPKAKFVPLKLLPDDSIKAQVVEVARNDKEVIKIAPIAVAVHKKETN